ncbi:MAG: polyprenyl synthetase family protein [Bacteroidia bacterium]|nr:polyprenyl synthetase family protein [Bacteroidia bacterium]
MSSSDIIKAPIAEEMKKFEPFFRASVKSPVSLLDIIIHYILRRKGKQMRPMFVFLSARLNGEINDSTFTAAAMIELLHTATLVHDDIVDDAYERRGFFSINALWKNKIAVLVGDFLLSKGLLLAVSKKEYELLEIVSEAVKEMSEGELLQIEKARRLNVSEEIYFDIIRKKTAALIAACCACGAKSVKADDAAIAQMKLFGEYVGMAFQLKDDLFDYQKNNFTGKPSGNDIKEKKLTLPLIHVLNKVDKSDRLYMINVVKNHNKNKKKVNSVIEMVMQNGGMEYASKIMFEFKEKALAILQGFPDNQARKSLTELVNYTVNRDK